MNVSAMTNKRPSRFTSSRGLASRMRMQERVLVSSVVFSLTDYLKVITFLVIDKQAWFNSVALKVR